MFDKLGNLLKSYLENDGKQEEHITVKAPPELYRDFIRLGVRPGAPLADCKKAYKKLLQKHHPDKHAANAFTLTIAHNIAAGINESFQRINRWYGTGKTD